MPAPPRSLFKTTCWHNGDSSKAIPASGRPAFYGDVGWMHEAAWRNGKTAGGKEPTWMGVIAEGASEQIRNEHVEIREFAGNA